MVRLFNEVIRRLEAERRPPQPPLPIPVEGHAAAAAAAGAQLRLSEYRGSGIESGFVDLETRLAQQARNQRWTAIVNLGLGLFICLGGFFFLVYVALFDRVTELTWPHIAAHYIPRVLAVALIELFGWFFVGLYRRGLDDVKYFENEVTNVVSRHLGMLAVVRADDQAIYAEVVRALINTDRNTAVTTGTGKRQDGSEDLIAAAGNAIATVVKKAP